MSDYQDPESPDQAFESEIREPTHKYPALEESWITKMQRYQPAVYTQPIGVEEPEDSDESPEKPKQNNQYFDLLNFSPRDLPEYRAEGEDQENSPNLPNEKPLVRGQSLEEYTDIDFGLGKVVEPKIEEKPASPKVENQTFEKYKLQNIDELGVINNITVPQAKLFQSDRMTASNLFPESLDNDEPNLPKTEQRMTKWDVERRANSNSFPETDDRKPEKITFQTFKDMKLESLDQLEMVTSVLVSQEKSFHPERETTSNLHQESLDNNDDDDEEGDYSPPKPKEEQRINKWGIAQKQWSPEVSGKVVGVSQLSFATEMGRDSDKISENNNKFEPTNEEEEEKEEEDHKVEIEAMNDQEPRRNEMNYGMRIEHQNGEVLLERNNQFEPPQEEEEENVEVVDDGVEEVKKVSMYTVSEEVFADDSMLYPNEMMNTIRQNILKISQTMGTQTNDQELVRRCQTITSSNYDIAIPEEKVIKDGYLYTYILYKIVTKIYEDEKKEYTVHRRYNDFNVLFEVLQKKYKGYVIPLLPPKNILTTINKESSEFSETRRKDLIDFLKKCMQHPFLQTTEEMFIFLTDDKGFHSFIKKEQQADAHHKNFDIWTIWGKVSQVASKVTSKKPVNREMTPLDNELHNHESSLVSLQSRLESFYKYMLQYLVLKRKNISNLIFFTKKLQTLAGRKREDSFEDLKKSLKNSTISSVEDKLIRDLTDLADNQLKGIIKTVEAMIYSLQKRNTVIEEIHKLQILIEEQELNVKKNLATKEQLDDLRKQYEILKEKFQKLSETLLKEVEYFRENITNELARFVQTVYENNEESLNEALQLWLIQKPSQ